MSDVALFGEGNPLANSDLFKSLQQTTDKLAGSVGTNRRISIKGGKFRKLVNGEQIEVTRDPAMNIIVIDAADVGRTYYAGEYDPEKVSKPTCWSADTDNPAPEVENPQSSRCADCPQNVKGSGNGQGRACRFSQRIAVAIEGDLETVYQLSLPATSLFGDGEGGRLPMQGYARYLREHKTPVIAIVTEMSFDDEDAEFPKLLFKPVRPLAEEELEAAVALKETTECKRAIEFTVAQSDGVVEPPKLTEEVVGVKEPVKEKPKKKAKAESEEPVEEPSVVKKKSKAPEPEAKNDLAAMIDDWDDE